MNFPSATLIAQSLLAGVFIGGLYGLIGLGLGLAWGLLHVINLAHFALVFLAAYLCYGLAGAGGMDPLATLVIIVPLFFAIGVAIQWLASEDTPSSTATPAAEKAMSAATPPGESRTTVAVPGAGTCRSRVSAGRRARRASG